MKKYVLLFGLFVLFSCINISIIPSVSAASNLYVSFSENPIVVSSGSSGYIELNIENVGNDKVDYIQIDTKILDNDVIKYQGNWDVYLGSLQASESTSIMYEFYIPLDATPGLYQVIFETDSSASDSKITAIIKVEAPSVLDLVSFSPNIIDIGKVETITFNISNTGGSPTKNILFIWDDPNDLILPVGSDNRIMISSIPENNFSELSIDVMASPSISAGVYPLEITMEYYDDTGTKQTITSEVGIQIGGGSDFEAVLQQSSSSSTTFAIANTGANVASSIIVTIPEQPNYVVNGVSSVSLGNLDPGDYTLASFQLSAVSVDFNTTERPSFNGPPSGFMSDSNFSNKQGFMNRSSESFNPNNNLIIEISYTDLFGIRQIIEKEVSISSVTSTIGSISNTDLQSRFGSGSRFSEQSSDSSDGTFYIIIGTIGIILIVIILKIGKNKKLKNIIKKRQK